MKEKIEKVYQTDATKTSGKRNKILTQDETINKIAAEIENGSEKKAKSALRSMLLMIDKGKYKKL